MSVACANKRVHVTADFRNQAHHNSVAEVRLCFARKSGIPSIEEEEDARQGEEGWPEYDPDAAYERHLENAGHEEAMLQEQMEAAAGVIPFEVALANANARQDLVAVGAGPAFVTKTIPEVLAQFPADTPAGEAGRALQVEAAKPLLDGFYTLPSQEASAGHRTFRLRTQSSKDEFMPGKQIIGYLTGPDNERDYTNIGTVVGGRLRVWARHRNNVSLVVDAQRLLADPDSALVAAHCYRCHALLTVPESVLSGYGPTCLAKGV